MSDPTFDTLSTHLEWRAAVNVSGVDPLPVQYSANQMFAPDHLMVSYYRSNNDPWTLINITVGGNKIIAKGKRNVRGKYVWIFIDEDGLPEWVRNFIALHKPTESETNHLAVTHLTLATDEEIAYVAQQLSTRVRRHRGMTISPDEHNTVIE